MEKLKNILDKYNFPAFLLKKNEIIAYNNEFKIICPDIEKIKDIRLLYNLKDDFIKQSYNIVVSNDFNAYSLNFESDDTNNADYLVFVTKIDEIDFLDPNYVFNNLLRLGYLIIDLDKDNIITDVDLPEYFKIKMGITNSYDFIKGHVTEQELERFQTKVLNFFLADQFFFDFNAKFSFSSHRLLNFQLRCFPKITKSKKQLFCSTIEYTEIGAINMQMNEAEKRFTQFYENSIDPIVIIDNEKIVSFNDAAFKISNSYNFQLIKGLNLNVILQDERKKDFLFDPKNHLKKISDSLETLDGRIVFFEYTIVPIKLYKNQNLLLIFNDLTETHHLLETLRIDEQKYKEILDTVFDGIVLTDNSIIEFWNKAAENITGYTKEELIGKSIHTIFDNSKNNVILDDSIGSNSFNTKNIFDHQTLAKTRIKNGKEIIINISITNYINNQGVNKALTIFRDITEKFNAEVEIRKQKEELNNVNIALKNFFSILAHDMRTPVTQMLSLSDFLCENLDSFSVEEQKKYLSLLNLASKNGLELLDSVVEWGRTMTNKVIFKKENFDLNDIIQKTIRLNTSIFLSKNISLEYLPNKKFVNADSNMVFTILNNLLSNAIKFSYKNSKIIIDTRSFDEYVQVSVQDFGIGIEDTETIFFYDSKNVSLGTEKEKGKGIGLLLTQELVKKNGGKIWIESKKGKGSTFYFTLLKSSEV